MASALVAACLAAACATLPPPVERSNLSQGAAACLDERSALDRTVDASGVRDASAYRIPAFPYLRVDRFSASFRQQAASGGAAFDTWVARLADLDRIARDVEFANLPQARASQKRAGECSALLVREDLADPARRTELISRASVPDDYSGWTRNSGLYAVASLPFSVGVEGQHKETEALFRQAANGDPDASRLRRYVAEDPVVPAEAIRAALSRAPVDALGIPHPDRAATELLFRAYAPTFEIETSGPYDLPGRVRWSSEGTPAVDAASPVVYRRLAYTRFQGRTLIQLVYTAWFAERPATSSFDILAGKLDGLVLRVTLDHDGRALAYDTIHPCGCYHLFFPTGLVAPKAAPDTREEWAFVPATLPVLAAGQRVSVRLASGTHYVVAIGPAGDAGGQAYGWAEDDELRALALPGGGTRSLFGPDALVAGSERPERLLFWPMGIASPGTMRQWGRQPTAFIGRRHFDDADLFDKRFERRTPP